MTTKDCLGDRMKLYEGREADRILMPNLPVMVRLDGQCFHSYTKGLKRPFDEGFSKLMVVVTEALVKESNACIGYTQSDEISLVIYNDDPKSQIYFNGRTMKITSLLAAKASVWFNQYKLDHLGIGFLQNKREQCAAFDCRVWNVPSKEEAANAILWRQLDCVKNSITMAAREHYSDKQLFKKNSSDKHEMLFKKGINWNDYPPFFKSGTFVRRKKKLIPFYPEEIEKLPKNHKARNDPHLLVERSVIETCYFPFLQKTKNIVGVLFDGEVERFNFPEMGNV